MSVTAKVPGSDPQGTGRAGEIGIDKKTAGRYQFFREFRFREADYGSYPKGLMYGIDIMDSYGWRGIRLPMSNKGRIFIRNSVMQ